MAQYLKIALLSFTNHEGNHQVHKGKDLGRTAVSVARALLPSKLANPPPPSDPSLPIGRVTKNPPKKSQEKARYIPFTATARALLPSKSAPSLRSESVSLHSLTHQEPSLVLQPEAPLRGQEVKRGVDEKQEIFLHRD